MFKSKIVRVVSYIIIIFIILFLIAGVLLNLFFDSKITTELKKSISKSTNNEYELSLDKLTINLLTNSIVVKNIKFTPSKNITKTKAQYLFKAKKLRIVNFSLLSYFRDRNLFIERLEFEEPELLIVQGYERLAKKQTTTDSTNYSIYKSISKSLNSISISNIDVLNLKFNIYKNANDSLPLFSGNDNSISIKKFIVSSEIDNSNRLFVAEKFDIIMNNFSYQLANGLYTIGGKKLYASYTDSTVVIDSLKLIPNYTKKQFAKEAEKQISRVNLVASKVNCQKMDVKLFFEYNWLVINKINIDDCTFDIYRDNTKPLESIIRPSLQAMLKNVPFIIAVDTVELKNAKGNFQVLNPKQTSLGKIEISEIKGTITGLQNDTTLYSDKSNINIQLSLLLMNQGKLTASFKFPLLNTKELFYCSGNLSSMPLSSFNSIISHSKNILIKTGQLDYASFSFIANDKISRGKMKFLYHDLNIDIINKDSREIKLKEKVSALLANKLLIINANPDKKGVVRVSTIYKEHNPYRYFTFNAIQSMLSGVLPSITNQKVKK